MATKMDCKYLQLSDPNQASAWMIQFNAMSQFYGVSDDTKLKQLFLSRCGVQAISTLRDALFPKKLDSCTYKDINDCVQSVITPSKKFVIAERIKFFETRQTQDESVSNFVLRLNSAISTCEFSSIKSDPDSELLKLIFISGLRSAELKFKLLDHLRLNETLTLNELVSLSNVILSQKTFVDGH